MQTEFDEQSTNAQEALALVRLKIDEYKHGDETLPVVAAYERAAVAKGASRHEIDELWRAAHLGLLCKPTNMPDPNLEQTDAQLRALWEKYQTKDYWGDATIITQKKAERDAAKTANPSLTTLPSDEEIEDFYHYQSLSFVHEQYTQINHAVREHDLDWLTAHVRYNQPLTLELFELVTGAHVKGFSNRKLQTVFSQL